MEVMNLAYHIGEAYLEYFFNLEWFHIYLMRGFEKNWKKKSKVHDSLWSVDLGKAKNLLPDGQIWFPILQAESYFNLLPIFESLASSK